MSWLHKALEYVLQKVRVQFQNESTLFSYNPFENIKININKTDSDVEDAVDDLNIVDASDDENDIDIEI